MASAHLYRQVLKSTAQIEGPSPHLTVDGLPLQICANLQRLFRSVDKTQFQKDTISNERRYVWSPFV